ncbi:MAG: hypothetical protein Fur005_21820 [Roseiflexaceae bacterium]
MSTEIQAMTGAEAGLNSQRQIEIALQAMVEGDGEATNEAIYAAVERYMGGAVLSQQGRDTLRSLINREAVRRGLVYQYDPNQAGWRITDDGRTLVANLPDEVKPEGLDANTFDLGEYPIDSLLIRSETRTVFEVVRRMSNNQYILDPDFQREFVWDETKQSKLIESALMRIPLPVFYLAENPDGRVVVVDGLQRLSTFQRFLKNELVLRGLKGNSEELNGLRFEKLPPKLQNRIEDAQLVLYIIDAKVPDRARLDIFERVNSGVALSRQQMRNCLYVGDATRWLRERARSQVFLEATGRGLNSHTMRDREAINRFCSFYFSGVEGYRELKGDIDEFLAQTLLKMNAMGSAQLAQKLTPVFERSMQNNFMVFGKHAFRKHSSPDDSRNVINIALFDVYSVLMTRYSETFVAEHRVDFNQRFYALQTDEAFRNAITISTNDVRNVAIRFERIEAVHADLVTDLEKI